MTSPFDEPPTMMLTGEIEFPDGRTMLIPQPVKFTQWTPPAQDAYITDTQEVPCPDLWATERISLPEPTESHSPQLGRPAWAWVCVLVALGILVGAITTGGILWFGVA